MSLSKLLRDFPVIGHFVVPLVLVISVCGALVGWRNEYATRMVAQSKFTAAIRHERQNTAEAEVRRAVAEEALRHAGGVVTVTRDRLRVISDTIRLGIHLGDTNAVMATLPTFLAASDSAMAACTQYQTSCEVYRHVSDSLVASLRRQIALHETRETPKLPRLRLTADALYDPLTQTPAMAAGVELRVAGPVSLTLSGLERFGDTPRLYVGVRGVF